MGAGKREVPTIYQWEPAEKFIRIDLSKAIPQSFADFCTRAKSDIRRTVRCYCFWQYICPEWQGKAQLPLQQTHIWQWCNKHSHYFLNSECVKPCICNNFYTYSSLHLWFTGNASVEALKHGRNAVYVVEDMFTRLSNSENWMGQLHIRMKEFNQPWRHIRTALVLELLYCVYM